MALAPLKQAALLVLIGMPQSTCTGQTALYAAAAAQALAVLGCRQELSPGASLRCGNRHPAPHCRREGGAQVRRDMLLEQADPSAAQVLLIRRAKPPSEGMFSFPGGSQELGSAAASALSAAAGPMG